MHNHPDRLDERAVQAYPALAAVPRPERLEWLSNGGLPMSAGPGTVLFDEGSPCQAFPLVLSGCVRVAKGSPDGRRLELYRVSAGELCVVSASCLMGPSVLMAHGQTIETTELLLIDPARFDRWCQYPGFRRAVMGVFAQRLADLMGLVEAVSFQRLDQRLAQALCVHGPELHTTHQALADELGTVREMVSRLLNRFERAGWVSLGRERIVLTDADALRRLAKGDALALG